MSAKVGKILLIVDSSLFIIERLVAMIREVDVVEEIFTATSYREAVDILHKEATDIVLLDIEIPVKHGIELLKYIVQHFTQTKVIVLSNESSDYYQKLCKREGAFDFIDKSKEFDRITAVLSSI